MTPTSITIVVSHEFDRDTRHPAEQEKGSFWDPNDTDIHDTPEAQEEVREMIRAWMNDEWHYVGVVVRVGVTLPYTAPLVPGSEPVERTAHDTETQSLWGIESTSGDEYFIEVAQDLLGEALAALGLPQAHVGLIDKPTGTWELPPF